jgi:VanZ family protein
MYDRNQNLWRGRFFRYAPLIVWIGVVLLASTMLGAMSNTSRFIRPLLVFLFPDAPEETLQIYHNYVRKFAHFAEYGILAFWASRAFSTSSVKLLRKYWFIFAFLIVLFIASIDEFNQSFNSLRTGSGYDVLLDCAGGLTITFVFAIWKIRVKKM